MPISPDEIVIHIWINLEREQMNLDYGTMSSCFHGDDVNGSTRTAALRLLTIVV